MYILQSITNGGVIVTNYRAVLIQMPAVQQSNNLQIQSAIIAAY